MDPKWVMTQEQKQVRFQHYYKKKMEKEKRSGQSSVSPPQTSSASQRFENLNLNLRSEMNSRKFSEIDLEKTYNNRKLEFMSLT